MRSEDTGLLPQITTALNNLRAQGTPLGVDIQQVLMKINGATVRYSFDTANNDWQVTAE